MALKQYTYKLYKMYIKYIHITYIKVPTTVYGKQH